MNNPKPLAPGLLVVVVHTVEPEYSFLVGQVGTIISAIRGVPALLTNAEWIVDLPNTGNIPCPHCHKVHPGTEWPMLSIELKPLEDPDQGLEQTEDKRIDQPLEQPA